MQFTFQRLTAIVLLGVALVNASPLPQSTPPPPPPSDPANPACYLAPCPQTSPSAENTLGKRSEDAAAIDPTNPLCAWFPQAPICQTSPATGNTGAGLTPGKRSEDAAAVDPTHPLCMAFPQAPFCQTSPATGNTGAGLTPGKRSEDAAAIPPNPFCTFYPQAPFCQPSPSTGNAGAGLIPDVPNPSAKRAEEAPPANPAAVVCSLMPPEVASKIPGCPPSPSKRAEEGNI